LELGENGIPKLALSRKLTSIKDKIADVIDDRGSDLSD
jgi:hypothetical protein